MEKNLKEKVLVALLRIIKADKFKKQILSTCT